MDPTTLFTMCPTNVSNNNLYTSCFPQDVDKYTRYDKILERSSFGQLCNMCCMSNSGSAQRTYLVGNFTFNMDSIELNTTGILSSR